MVKAIILLNLMCCLSVASEPIKINLNQLRDNLEEKLNISRVTFEKTEFGEISEFGITDWLIKKPHLEFKFERFGNVMTAKCFSRKNSPKENPGLYLKCKTYNSEKKESPLTSEGEISQGSQVLDGVQPIITFPTNTSKESPASKNLNKGVQ